MTSSATRRTPKCTKWTRFCFQSAFTYTQPYILSPETNDEILAETVFFLSLYSIVRSGGFVEPVVLPFTNNKNNINKLYIVSQ